MNEHVPFQLSVVQEALVAAIEGALELKLVTRQLTSLSPCTVICFFNDALSLKILAQDSR
jgi:hypothetical protein